MSIANSTLHFHFPLVVGTDRPLFEDYNQTMETLDEKLYESISTLETIPQEITDLQTAVNGIAGQITALKTFETQQTGTNQLVNNAILALQQAVAVIPTKFDSAGIADPYDADHGTYSVGDVVTYNGQRYECSQAVTAAEPFDADKWTAIDIQTVINSLKTALATEVTTINNILADLETSYNFAESLASSAGGGSAITLSKSIKDYAMTRFENSNYGVTEVALFDTQTTLRLSTMSMSGSILVLCVAEFTISDDGKTLTPNYQVQVNVESSGVTLFNTSATYTWNVIGLKQIESV